MSDLSNKVVDKAVVAKKELTVEDHLRNYQAQLQRSLGDSMDAAKFTQDALTAIKANPKIGQADQKSLFGALFLAAQLKLPVGGPLAQFHLTTRNNTDKESGEKKTTIVPIIGYNGYIQLAMNTGLYSKVEAFLVYENDYFKRGANSERGQFYEFEASNGDRGSVIGAIGSGKLRGFNETSWVFVDYDTVITKHRPVYWKGTPWATNENDQILKTAIRVWQKWVPKSSEATGLALAASADQAEVRKHDGVEGLEIDHDVVEAEVVEPSV